MELSKNDELNRNYHNVQDRIELEVEKLNSWLIRRAVNDIMYFKIWTPTGLKPSNLEALSFRMNIN